MAMMLPVAPPVTESKQMRRFVDVFLQKRVTGEYIVIYHVIVQNLNEEYVAPMKSIDASCPKMPKKAEYDSKLAFCPCETAKYAHDMKLLCEGHVLLQS